MSEQPTVSSPRLRVHETIDKSKLTPALKDVMDVIGELPLDCIHPIVTSFALKNTPTTTSTATTHLVEAAATLLHPCAHNNNDTLFASTTTPTATTTDDVQNAYCASVKTLKASACVQAMTVHPYVSKVPGALTQKAAVITEHVHAIATSFSSVGKAIDFMTKVQSADPLLDAEKLEVLSTDIHTISAAVDSLDKRLGLSGGHAQGKQKSNLQQRMLTTMTLDDEIGQWDYFSKQRRVTLEGSFVTSTSKPIYRWVEKVQELVTVEWLLQKSQTREVSVYDAVTDCVVSKVEKLERNAHPIRAFTLESQLCYEGNRAMREFPTKQDKDFLNRFLPFELLLDDALLKLPPFVGLVYRGVNMILPMVPGQIITFLQPSSASTDARVVKDFLSKGGPGSLPRGMIYVIESFSGRSIEHISDFPEEREVLF
eukprot:PhF_6_TR38613/c1_g1_i6/m.57508